MKTIQPHKISHESIQAARQMAEAHLRKLDYSVIASDNSLFAAKGVPENGSSWPEIRKMTNEFMGPRIDVLFDAKVISVKSNGFPHDEVHKHAGDLIDVIRGATIPLDAIRLESIKKTPAMEKAAQKAVGKALSVVGFDPAKLRNLPPRQRRELRAEYRALHMNYSAAYSNAKPDDVAKAAAVALMEKYGFFSHFKHSRHTFVTQSILQGTIPIHALGVEPEELMLGNHKAFESLLNGTADAVDKARWQIAVRNTLEEKGVDVGEWETEHFRLLTEKNLAELAARKKSNTKGKLYPQLPKRKPMKIERGVALLDELAEHRFKLWPGFLKAISECKNPAWLSPE